MGACRAGCSREWGDGDAVNFCNDMHMLGWGKGLLQVLPMVSSYYRTMMRDDDMIRPCCVLLLPIVCLLFCLLGLFAWLLGWWLDLCATGCCLLSCVGCRCMLWPHPGAMHNQGFITALK